MNEVLGTLVVLIGLIFVLVKIYNAWIEHDFPSTRNNRTYSFNYDYDYDDYYSRKPTTSNRSKYHTYNSFVTRR